MKEEKLVISWTEKEQEEADVSLVSNWKEHCRNLK